MQRNHLGKCSHHGNVRIQRFADRAVCLSFCSTFLELRIIDIRNGCGNLKVTFCNGTSFKRDGAFSVNRDPE